MDFHVRPAESADVSQVWEIYQNDRNDLSLGNDYTREQFEDLIILPGRHFLFVADAAGELLGFLLAFDLTIWGYLDVLCVRKKYRGCGAGRALLKHLELNRLPRWRDIHCVHATHDNKLAPFLESCGFTTIPEMYFWSFKSLTPASGGH